MNSKPELAFPFKCQSPTMGSEIYYGMTLRDYFAAHAPDCPEWFYQINGNQKATQRTFALWAYSYADEMMKARGQ